jgi:hypothetical protein
VSKDRDWERSYRGRWAHDKVVCSTHGDPALALQGTANSLFGGLALANCLLEPPQRAPHKRPFDFSPPRAFDGLNPPQTPHTPTLSRWRGL